MLWTDPRMKARFAATKGLWHAKIIRLVRQKRATWKYVADVGCGRTGLLEGVWRQDWPQGTAPIVGIGFDTDHASLQECRTRAARGRLPLIYINSDAEDIGSVGLSFDIIFCWEVLYLLTDAKLGRALAAMRQILARHGLLVIGTATNLSLEQQSRIEHAIGRTAHWRTDARYMSLLRRNGFRVEPRRIVISPAEYDAHLKKIPAHALWCGDEAQKEEYYMRIGKPVWLCSLQRGSRRSGECSDNVY